MIHFGQQHRRLFTVLLLVGGAVLVWLSPAERTLGQTVKLVYIHGALVRTATLLFALGIPLNLLGLFFPGTVWPEWGKAVAGTAVLIWLAHTLFSIITTYAAWGIFIAWYEPRTRFTFMLAGVSLVVGGAAWFVNDSRFTAAALAILGGLTLGLLPQLGVLQHPLDPIGTSTSTAIRWFYAAILMVSIGLGGLLTLWLHEFFLTKDQRQYRHSPDQMQ